MSIRSLLLAAVFTAALSPASAAPTVMPMTVFAAASLTNVLEPIGVAFTASTAVPVRFSFASSAQLARQIESGAAADVFVSADLEWMDYLESRGLVAAQTRRNVASNTLVLIAPADSTLQLRIARDFPLAAALGAQERLATGEPGSVPAGRYARAALLQLGVWPTVAARIVGADSVRTALNFVARGDAALGIVYGTDARMEPRVRVLDVFPAGSHPPITYPAAATARAGPQAERFVAYLVQREAQAHFRRAGFGAP